MLASELFGTKWSSAFEDFEVKGIANNSGKVQDGYVFVCIKGFVTDGHKYIDSAVASGARAVVVQDDVSVSGAACIQYDDTRIAIAELACKFYGNPSERFSLIGVTGTNGKTTTTHLIRDILESAGKCVGLIGTNGCTVGDKMLVTKTTTPTTPNSLELQQMFDEMLRGGAECVVMEVSSHALDLNRVHGCKFRVGAFSNLTQDHLDYHHTMENYFEAKAKLFKMAEKGVVNIDDEYGRKLLNMYPDMDIMTFSVDSDSDLKAEILDITPRGTDINVLYEGQRYENVHIPIPGKFSVYNALCAMASVLSVGIDIETVINGINLASGVLGRAEVVPVDTDYTVIIDYAHTDDGLKNIITAMKAFAKGRVITLFGCGGDRDKSKRALMGRTVGELADFAVITSDNPRTENPADIIDMIVEGIKPTGKAYKVIENRRDAIEWVLDFAEKDDIIILAGKGQETYQIIGTEKTDFDERAVVYNVLNRKEK